MKKQLEKEIIKAHKKEQLTTARPISDAIQYNVRNNPSTKDLTEDEQKKIIQSRVIRINKDRKKKLKNVSVEELNDKLSIDELIEHHLKHNERLKSKTLLVLYKFLELEDENKKLTLTDEQYQNWLISSNSNQYINTKQFEILYALSSRQQKSLRTKINDPLPHFKLTENSNILYNRIEVEKWLENYSGKMVR